MQSVTLTYTDSDYQSVSNGWLITHRGNHKLDCDEMYASTNGKQLVHDVLEHWDFRQTNMNLQELVALGSIYAHRSGDFYNSYTGGNSLPDTIAEQLAALERDDMIECTALPYSRNEQILSEVESLWDEIVHSARVNEDIVFSNPRKARAIAHRFMSRGYNHVTGIGVRNNHDFLFNNMFYNMIEVLDDGLMRVDCFNGMTVKLSYSFAQESIVLSQQIEYYDDNYRYKTMQEVLASY